MMLAFFGSIAMIILIVWLGLVLDNRPVRKDERRRRK